MTTQTANPCLSAPAETPTTKGGKKTREIVESSKANDVRIEC